MYLLSHLPSTLLKHSLLFSKVWDQSEDSGVDWTLFFHSTLVPFSELTEQKHCRGRGMGVERGNVWEQLRVEHQMLFIFYDYKKKEILLTKYLQFITSYLLSHASFNITGRSTCGQQGLRSAWRLCDWLRTLSSSCSSTRLWCLSWD